MGWSRYGQPRRGFQLYVRTTEDSRWPRQRENGMTVKLPLDYSAFCVGRAIDTTPTSELSVLGSSRALKAAAGSNLLLESLWSPQSLGKKNTAATKADERVDRRQTFITKANMPYALRGRSVLISGGSRSVVTPSSACWSRASQVISKQWS